MEEIAAGLLKFNSPSPVYVTISPEIPDITVEGKLKITLLSKDSSFAFSFNPEGLELLGGLLSNLVFNKDSTIIAWNIKPFFSYWLNTTNKPFEFKGKLFDLSIIESFMGDKLKKPQSFKEAAVRTKNVLEKIKDWELIYRTINLPLIKETIPYLENQRIFDMEQSKPLYAHYDIEGQINGRLRCSLKFKNGFNPHNLGPKERAVMSPGSSQLFMSFDFVNMEVAVLQWLSKDVNLGKMLNVKHDFYELLYYLVTEKRPSDKEDRSFAKSLFLPVIFGQEAPSLAKNLKISEETAQSYINILKDKFKTAFDYVQTYPINDDHAFDYLSRRRRFNFKEYNSKNQLRNFIIQAPAAMVCMEKLIALVKEFEKTDNKVGFSIHDGYCLYVRDEKYELEFKKTKEILESPSKVLPGLVLRVSCEMGKNLNEMEKK
jgi:hypothetical protein